MGVEKVGIFFFFPGKAPLRDGAALLNDLPHWQMQKVLWGPALTQELPQGEQIKSLEKPEGVKEAIKSFPLHGSQDLAEGEGVRGHEKVQITWTSSII